MKIIRLLRMMLSNEVDPDRRVLGKNKMNARALVTSAVHKRTHTRIHTRPQSNTPSFSARVAREAVWSSCSLLSAAGCGDGCCCRAPALSEHAKKVRGDFCSCSGLGPISSQHLIFIYLAIDFYVQSHGYQLEIIRPFSSDGCGCVSYGVPESKTQSKSEGTYLSQRIRPISKPKICIHVGDGQNKKDTHPREKSKRNQTKPKTCIQIDIRISRRCCVPPAKGGIDRRLRLGRHGSRRCCAKCHA